MAEHDYTDKVALVTGGGSGIGEACAMTFARSGAKVIVADFDKDGGDRVTEAIRAEGLDATFLKVDVSKPDQIEAMVAATVETYGGLHVAVNNAGIGGAQALTGEYPIDSWQQVIEVNLSGVFYCMRHEIPAMLDSGGGSIINMASILGSVGFANSPAYVAAKHGVVGSDEDGCDRVFGTGNQGQFGRPRFHQHASAGGQPRRRELESDRRHAPDRALG